MRNISLPIKIGFSFLLAIVILILSARINSQNANKIRATVNQLATPNTEQQIFQQLFKNIVIADQWQRNTVNSKHKITNSQVYDSINNQIHQSISVLIKTNEQQPEQLSGLIKLDSLLKQKEQLAEIYIALNKDYIQSDSSQAKIDRLSDFIQKSYLRSDTSIFTTQSSITATTVGDTLNAPTNEEKNVGLWNRLFGKKKEPIVKEVRYFVLEKLNMAVDSLHLMQDDSIIVHLSNSIQGLQNQRRSKLQNLYQQRRALDEASALLIDEIVLLIENLENNINLELYAKNKQATENIDHNLNSIKFLIVIFIIIVLVMSTLIVRDLLRQVKNKKALIEAKEEADRLGLVKEQFLSKMSHELRSPLQSIIGYTELMQSSPKQEQVTIVTKAAQHLLAIVNQILDYNQLIQHKMALYNKEYFLLDLLNEVQSLTQIQILNKNLILNWNNKNITSKTLVLGDAMKLKQILINLLHNAVKFTNKGFVNAKFELKNNLLCIAIKDSGIGIDEKNQAKIFNYFEQLPNTDQSEGSGLGLSIVNEMVHLLGGKIELTATLGKGSNFFIELPIQLVDKKYNTSFNEDRDILNLSNGPIWLIEDDELIRTLCEHIFKEHSIAYKLFSHPDEILKEPIPKDLNAIFIDLRLPGISGQDVMLALKNKINSSTRLIAFTAQAFEKDTENLMNLGFDDVLLKPFTQKQFLEKIGSRKIHIQDELNQDELIWKTFQTATAIDIEKLQYLVTKGSIEEINEIMHQLASRLSQMNYIQEGVLARRIEISLKNQQLPLKQIQELFFKVSEILTHKPQNYNRES